MTPSPDAMRAAAEWLSVYEDGADSVSEMLSVADWLMKQADAAELRAICKEIGVSVAVAKRNLRGKS